MNAGMMKAIVDDYTAGYLKDIKYAGESRDYWKYTAYGDRLCEENGQPIEVRVHRKRINEKGERKMYLGEYRVIGTEHWYLMAHLEI